MVEAEPREEKKEGAADWPRRSLEKVKHGLLLFATGEKTDSFCSNKSRRRKRRGGGGPQSAVCLLSDPRPDVYSIMLKFRGV